MYCIVLLYVFASLCVAGADGLVECREMVRSGVLSYLLVSLSSHMADTRKAATHCLSRFYAHLRSSTCREKPQVRSALPTPHSSFSMKSNLLLTSIFGFNSTAMYSHIHPRWVSFAFSH